MRAAKSSSLVGTYSSLQCSQSRRARRCASTPVTAAPVRNGSTPISFRRVNADGASFVCRVERTKWPVRAASIEIFAVSTSRISPTITTSGSERRIERSAVANVSPARRLICTWFRPASRYSTGSSTVITLISGRLISVIAAKRVVDLPEPVGPVTSSAPVGRWISAPSRSCISAPSPTCSIVGGFLDLSRRRMTTASPSTVGRVAARTSSIRPAADAESEMRPSCGFRRSAVSGFAGTFRRRGAPVRRLPAFGDVELREHLQARGDADRAAPGDPLGLVENAVDAEADDERVRLRLEVDVAGAVLGRFEDDRVDEPDERGVGDAVVDLEIVDLFLVDHLELGGLAQSRACAERLGRARESPELVRDVFACRHAEDDRVPAREAQ